MTKSYYYGAAPAPKQHPGATGTASAFGGAALGAAAGPKLTGLSGKAKTLGPKIKAAKIAIKAV